jgi:hypothetical protein
MKTPNHLNNSPGWALILYALLICLACRAILSGEVLTKTEVTPIRNDGGRPTCRDIVTPCVTTGDALRLPLNHIPVQSVSISF